MKLDRVTITGADDSVKPCDLSELSDQFPFVEWAILFSPKHQASPRWPSKSWCNELIYECDSRGINVAAHLCGGYLRDLLTGKFTFAISNPTLFSCFPRIQLNFHGEMQPAEYRAMDDGEVASRCDLLDDAVLDRILLDVEQSPLVERIVAEQAAAVDETEDGERWDGQS